MTKMAAMSIYDKNPSKIFSGTSVTISMKLDMCSIDDPGSRVSFAVLCLSIGKQLTNKRPHFLTRHSGKGCIFSSPEPNP